MQACGLSNLCTVRLKCCCRVLDLSNCRGIGSEALRASLAKASNAQTGGLPHLHTLSLQGLGELSDQLLSDIALALPQLRSVDLRLCAGITDAGEHSCRACMDYSIIKLRVRMPALPTFPAQQS